MYDKLSSLSLAIPKLSFIPHAEDLASQFLQVSQVYFFLHRYQRNAEISK